MATAKTKQNHDASNNIIMVFLSLFMVFVSSCENPILTTVEPISKILESPSKYHNKIVTIKGKVTESFLVFGKGYFMLSEAVIPSKIALIPSKIAVIPSKTFPKVGEEVQIKGMVKNAFVIGDKSLTVIMEGE
jgi:hypothetical protein